MSGIASTTVPSADDSASASERRELGSPEQPQIGWLRAIATGLAVIIVGFFGAVVGPNLILTKSLALTRGARELLATVLFFTVITALAVTLRWLQHRKLI
jgi:hypothetical protein